MGPVGSGVLCVGSAVTIVDCVFRQNVATDKGGGLCCVWSDAILDSCSFIDNTTRDPVETFRGDGGGVLCESSTLVLSRCAFISNFVGGQGGGLYSHGGHVDLDECRFEANASSDFQGGAMAVSGFSTGIASNCTFVSNSAPDGGAAVLYGSPRTFSNCRFEYNTAHGAISCRGGAVFIEGGLVQFDGCLFSHNSASDIEEEGSGGAIFIDQSGDARITGSTLYENTASTGPFGVGRGSGVFVGLLGHADLENTIITASRDAEAITALRRAP
jgi:Right handed beta helix region